MTKEYKIHSSLIPSYKEAFKSQQDRERDFVEAEKFYLDQLSRAEAVGLAPVLTDRFNKLKQVHLTSKQDFDDLLILLADAPADGKYHIDYHTGVLTYLGKKEYH